MSNDVAEDHEKGIEYAFDVDLSERELFLIGKIIALWGSLEYEIFCQTLLSFEDLSDEQLPKGNEKFYLVLRLWEIRVVASAEGRHKEVLDRQCRSIRHYQGFRNALPHGMWAWSKDAPHKITAIHKRKKEIISTTFTADDLESFASDLAAINFNVRYPGGREELAAEMASRGHYLSRHAHCVMTGNPLANELFPVDVERKR